MLTRNRTTGESRNPPFGSACVNVSTQYVSEFEPWQFVFIWRLRGGWGGLSGCGGFDRVVLILVPVLSLQEDKVNE